MKVSIIGVGAIGGYVFAKLSETNRHNLQCVVSQHSALLEHNEIKLSHSTQSSRSPIENITSDYSAIGGELIFITLKSTHNAEVFPQLAHLRNKTFVVIQNGIGNEAHLAQFLHESNTIIGATTNIKVTKTSAGNQVTLHKESSYLNYAHYHEGTNELDLESVFNLLFGSVSPKDDIFQARFPKLLVNASCNLASIIYDACMQTLSTAAEPRQLVEDIGQEVIQVAQAYGVNIDPSTVSQLFSHLAVPEFKGVYFSMKEDFDSGRDMEIETIFHNLVELANKANVQMPKTQASLNTLLSMIDQRNTQSQLCS
ncbi:ketopantoate reductase family protein [Vibrio marisflavi]|nr:2-dehydropantoate 2-reductase [Vibrio marisflavi]